MVPFFFSCFGYRSQLAIESDHLCGVENFHSAQGEWLYHVVLAVRHPRGSYIVLPLLPLDVAIPEIK